MKIRTIACAVAAWCIIADGISSTQAATPMTVTMQVTAHGLVVSGVTIQDRRMTIPRGTKVRLLLVHADANRNTHKFTVTAKHTELTSPAIDGDVRKTAAIEFTVGDRGEEFYRLSCELPCIAMDELVDYIIMVGPANVTAL